MPHKEGLFMPASKAMGSCY